MNVRPHPSGGFVVRVEGDSLGDTARPGQRLVLEEIDGLPDSGDLCLFRSGPCLLFRRVEHRGADTIALHPETGGAPTVLHWPEDAGEYEAVARVDRVLKRV